MSDNPKGAISTINFDFEKNGYNKEQVTKYFEKVKKEYEEMYAENQNLRDQLQQARQYTDSKTACDIPPDRMEAIALALVSAQTEAQRIVNTARETAWQIITDAKKGLPMAEAPAPPAPAVNAAEKEEPVIVQTQKPAAAPAQNAAEDIDKLIEAMINERWLGESK